MSITLTEAQSKVLPYLEAQASSQLIRTDLGWSRQRLHAVLDGLEGTGLLRAYGELPPDSVVGALPSVRELTEEGHSVRRVEWSTDLADHAVTWVVQSVLLPRPDRRDWRRASPFARIVAVTELDPAGHDRGDTLLWEATRNLIVPISEVRERRTDLALDEHVGLTMALAWVLETRALLDTEALTGSTLLEKR